MESRENPQLQRKPTQHIGIGLLELRMQKHLVLRHVFREMMGVWSMPNPFVIFFAGHFKIFKLQVRNHPGERTNCSWASLTFVVLSLVDVCLLPAAHSTSERDT